MRRGGGKPGRKRTHLIDLYMSAAACKAVYAGSIPTPASKKSNIYIYHRTCGRRICSVTQFACAVQPCTHW